ncbi:Mannan-binding protein [Mycobacterium basiliense]|uniref:Mannan-binding protein n=1 Tax=Mycobacterium basiliense TaxID=2094119 RepID=A0A3S4DWS2_9MYCO|nr:Mannan-binding protein [Mycobacterium basiliense]
MVIQRLVATVSLVAAFAAATLSNAFTAHASAASFCGELAGEWDGQYCHTTAVSERNAVRDIKVAVPGELVDNPTAGPVVRDYLRTLVNNWRTANARMVADSFGEENYQVFEHAGLLSVVFHEVYHADGPKPNNAYRTFAFDLAAGRRVQLADLTTSDPLTAIPPLARPFVETALDQAPPLHDPGTYPFVIDRWTPDKVYSGAYRAWALAPGELILYMPDYPVGHDEPVNFTPGVMQWYLDGGTVQAHIPLSALSSVLRPEFVAG